MAIKKIYGNLDDWEEINYLDLPTKATILINTTGDDQGIINAMRVSEFKGEKGERGLPGNLILPEGFEFSGIGTDFLTQESYTEQRQLINTLDEGASEDSLFATKQDLANGLYDLIPQGTTMLFMQANAPVGWTKVTTHDNKALRVVSGTGGMSYGSTSFTSTFTNKTPSGSVNRISDGSVHSHVLTINEMPYHNHDLLGDNVHDVDSNLSGIYKNTAGGYRGIVGYGSGNIWGSQDPYGRTNYIGHAGANWGHSHGFTNPTYSFAGNSMNFDIQYVDVIVATKN